MSSAKSTEFIPLWAAWWDIVRRLRPAFSRYSTFLWFAAAVAAACVRPDLRGVTSFVRALGLQQRCYWRLLDFFHSTAVKLPLLRTSWTAVVLTLLRPLLLTVNGRIVLLADGIKAPKTGRKMPGVKKLHQESQTNSKPEYIFGHSCQAIAVVARAAASFLAVPLAISIHEGVVFSNRDKRTLLDKLVVLLGSLGITIPLYLVADRYYASAKVIAPLLGQARHLIAAVRSNAVAYLPAPPPKIKRRGRPKKYGRKLLLRSLFKDRRLFLATPSPVYGERGVEILCRTLDLYWRPVGRLVRFVLVIHPARGNMILLSTDLTLDALEVVRCYGTRFKIEVAFKQAVHAVGTWCYHFWMADMEPRPNRSGNQHVHRKSDRYRAHVRRKLAAYHCHLQVGAIAQGALQILSILHADTVWRRFGSWLRTIRPGIAPSETVVSLALRQCLPEFLVTNNQTNDLAKFISANLDLDRAEGWCLAS
jgi:hypothetical protein